MAAFAKAGNENTPEQVTSLIMASAIADFMSTRLPNELDVRYSVVVFLQQIFRFLPSGRI